MSDTQDRIDAARERGETAARLDAMDARLSALEAKMDELARPMNEITAGVKVIRFFGAIIIAMLLFAKSGDLSALKSIFGSN